MKKGNFYHYQQKVREKLHVDQLSHFCYFSLSSIIYIYNIYIYIYIYIYKLQDSNLENRFKINRTCRLNILYIVFAELSRDYSGSR